MENVTITTKEFGVVQVSYDCFDWIDDTKYHLEKSFTSDGSYVYQIFDNGKTKRVCERLAQAGPALMVSGSLEETIRKTLGF